MRFTLKHFFLSTISRFSRYPAYMEHEWKLIAENSGLWPPLTREELSQQPSLSPVQVDFVAKAHRVSGADRD